MKRLLADSLVLIVAYWVAMLLRFDFGTPTWGWGPVLMGLPSVLIIGWGALLICRCQRLRSGTVSLRSLPRFIGAAGLMAAVQLLWRLILDDTTDIYFRPPVSVTLMAAVLSLAGWLALRYVRRLQLRPIEVADLIGRVETEVGTALVREGLRNKVVLITGAGGSIGSELTRQVLAAHPAKVILVDLSEAALYTLCETIEAQVVAGVAVAVTMDCGDAGAVRALFDREKPEIVLHAAAYKHVPMMECNPLAAIKNNALATRTVAEAAQAVGVKTFVLVSTDKAIHPISVMGVSKRLAEIFVRDLAANGKTCFCAVRFGNVLNSSGSVVPKFREQIARGGPVTLTDPRMKRYFMTLSEASGLVLQAAMLARGGEIFVLDMGEQVLVKQVAETMIRLSGLTPEKDIQIVCTGIRPGEKLEETLGLEDPSTRKTEHPRIFVSDIPQRSREATMALLAQCRALAEANDTLTPQVVKTLLNEEGKDS